MPLPEMPDNNKGGFDLRRYRGLLVWMAILFSAFFFWFVTQGAQPGRVKKLTYNELEAAIRDNRIESFLIEKPNYNITGKFRTEGTDPKEPTEFVSKADQEVISDLVKLANTQQVKYDFLPPSVWAEYLRIIIPTLFFLLLLYFLFFRQIRSAGGPGGVFSFGKSRATRITRDKVKKTFADVAGIDEACEEVAEIIEFLRNPDKFRALGGRLPRGCLLIGSP
ncbi:MAG: ATP-dependent metallopeptidase FtsH/Yme1/Tma family protein, partial [Planctomycetota bacterium]